MSNEFSVSFYGNLGDEPKVIQYGDSAFISLRICVNFNKKNNATGQWEAVGSEWYECNVGKNISGLYNRCSQFRKGERVFVTGTLTLEKYVTNTGEEKSAYKVHARDILPAPYVKTENTQSQGFGNQQGFNQGFSNNGQAQQSFNNGAGFVQPTQAQNQTQRQQGFVKPQQAPQQNQQQNHTANMYERALKGATQTGSNFVRDTQAPATYNQLSQQHQAAQQLHNQQANVDSDNIPF